MLECLVQFEPEKIHHSAHARIVHPMDAWAGVLNNTEKAVTFAECAESFTLIWGDPAQATQDAAIVAAVRERRFQAEWGRSWIHYCKVSNTLNAAVDQLGLFPILIKRENAGVILSSHRRLLLQSQSKPLKFNSDGILQMLAFGQCLDDTSILQDVTHPRGGSLIRISSTGKTTVEQPAPLLLAGRSKASLDDGIESFVAATGDCLMGGDDPLVSISGGLDSRLILAACLQLKRKPTLLCYGHADSADMRIARDIAAKFSLPLLQAEPKAYFDRQWADRVAYNGGAEVPFQHGHSLMSAALLQQTRGRRLLTGTGAETFRAFYYDRGMPGFEMLGLRRLNAFWRERALRYACEEFGKLANPFYEAFPALADPLKSALDATIQNYMQTDMDCAHSLDSLYLGERVRRMVVAGQQLLDAYYVRTHPFLARDVVNTLSGLPVHYRLGSRFHREAIARLNPALADIEWDKTQRPLRNGLRWHERYPGLASRLGVHAPWGKQGAALLDAASLMGGVSSATLLPCLANAGLSDLEIQKGLAHWLQSGAAVHARGMAVTLQRWEQRANALNRVAA